MRRIARDAPYTEADLPPLSWAVIRITKPGDLYVRHKLGYWREIITGKEVHTSEILNRVNAEGWETRTGNGGSWRNHVGFEELVGTVEHE